MAFLGNAWAKGSASTEIVTYVPKAMLGFVLGVLLSAIATGVKYLAMRRGFGTPSRAFSWWNRMSIFLVAASYIAFALGAVLAYSAFTVAG